MGGGAEGDAGADSMARQQAPAEGRGRFQGTAAMTVMASTGGVVKARFVGNALIGPARQAWAAQRRPLRGSAPLVARMPALGRVPPIARRAPRS